MEARYRTLLRQNKTLCSRVAFNRECSTSKRYNDMVEEKGHFFGNLRVA